MTVSMSVSPERAAGGVVDNQDQLRSRDSQIGQTSQLRDTPTSYGHATRGQLRNSQRHNCRRQPQTFAIDLASATRPADHRRSCFRENAE